MQGDAMGRRVTCREPDGLAEVLRREAAGEQPLFSQALHGRILRGLPATPVAAGVIQPAEPRGQQAGRSAWWQAILAAAATVLAVVVTAIDWDESEPAGSQLLPVAIEAGDRAAGSEVAAQGDAAAAAELGIDGIPTFDDLEAGVREGVSTLATTLLDVPEWRMLADFDAAGFLGADQAP
jgi:hypothetical protein